MYSYASPVPLLGNWKPTQKRILLVYDNFSVLEDILGLGRDMLRLRRGDMDSFIPTRPLSHGIWTTLT